MQLLDRIGPVGGFGEKEEKIIMQLHQNGIGLTIHIGQESWCLPHAGFWVGSLQRHLAAISSSRDQLGSYMSTCLGTAAENLDAHP